MRSPAQMLTLLASEPTTPPGEATGPAVQTPLSVLEPVLSTLLTVGVGLLVLGIVLCLYRIMRGPHLADRVLAADTLALHVVALVILLATHLRTTAFLDVALVVAIIGFVSSLAFAQYIGTRRNGRHKDPLAKGDQS